MNKIQLVGSAWEYDPSAKLGDKGGFGQVYVGRGPSHSKVAVKKLHVSASDAAHRELEIAKELSALRSNFILPVLASGQDAQTNDYFVVMPLADGDLQKAIDKAGHFDDLTAVSILLDIAQGLREGRQFVHRDIKPLNILHHEGHWKIADYGIARFTEEATAANTLKSYLSAPYAAPEQWGYERATTATDIYALGCIAYAVINGQPPFTSDFQNQHLHSTPPKLKTGNARLESLVMMMLRKQQPARPDIDRVISLLQGVKGELNSPTPNGGGGMAQLAQAGAKAAEASLQSEAKDALERTEVEERESLKNSAVRSLETEIIEPLFSRISDVAPTVERTSKYTLSLGDATLRYFPPQHSNAIVRGALPMSKWDLIALGVITVMQGGRKPYEWSASLLYIDRGQGAGYRWWELQFMTHPLIPRSRSYEPFASTDVRVIDVSLAKVMGEFQLGARPKLVDDEDSPAFQDRWAALFAAAVEGRIVFPHTLPID